MWIWETEKHIFLLHVNLLPPDINWQRIQEWNWPQRNTSYTHSSHTHYAGLTNIQWTQMPGHNKKKTLQPKGQLRFSPGVEQIVIGNILVLEFFY